MNNTIIKPNFFIVGAPKAGTTSMDHYLGQHPEIFISHRKDCHFFGSDLHKTTNEFFITKEEQYLRLFKQAANYKCRGESSVMYLTSKSAASEIKQFAPNAKIIILLRNPIEMMYAQHSQLFWAGFEDIASFPEAMAAEAQRRKGADIPLRNFLTESLYYLEIAKYSEQVDRYFQIFGRENVLVRLFDDLKKSTHDIYQDVLNFLEVDPSFIPDFTIINPNKTVRIPQLMHFLQAPPPFVKMLLSLLPDKNRIWFLKKLLRLNTKYKNRPPMDDATQYSLQEKLQNELETLSKLINRDLSHWQQ